MDTAEDIDGCNTTNLSKGQKHKVMLKNNISAIAIRLCVLNIWDDREDKDYAQVHPTQSVWHSKAYSNQSLTQTANRFRFHGRVAHFWQARISQGGPRLAQRT